MEYQFSIRPLSLEEGGGFSIEFPDLPGCMSDGDTIEEAIANGKDAVKGWIDTCKKLGRKIPKPNKQSAYSGKILSRFPIYLHEKLANRSKLENVSINSLIQTFVAEGLERKNVLEVHAITSPISYELKDIMPSKVAISNSAEANFVATISSAQHTTH